MPKQQFSYRRLNSYRAILSYTAADINFAFNGVEHICRDVNYGRLLRTLRVHAWCIIFLFAFIYA